MCTYTITQYKVKSELVNTEDTISMLLRGYMSQLIYLCLVPHFDLTCKPGILYIGISPPSKTLIVKLLVLSVCHIV